MKIIHVLLGKSNPETANGVNKFVNGIAEELHNSGYDVEVWGLSKNKCINFKTNYALKIFKQKTFFFIDDEIISEIKKLDNKSTIFHFHSVFIKEFHTIVKYLIKYDFKYSISPHSGYNKAALLNKNFFLKKIYINLFEKTIIKNARFIHVNNPSEIDYFNPLIKSKKVISTPNGYSLENLSFKNTVKKKYVIGFMGRFSIQQKGLDLLLNGFKKYIQSDGKGILYLIGNGDLSNLITNLPPKVKSKIKLFGPSFGSEKEVLLSDMSIFIHTSRWEGFPLALIEAAANSLPLIVSKQTNLNDYVNRYDAGIVLDRNSPDDICESLLRGEHLFEENILQTRISKNAYCMVENEFSWKNIMNKLLEGYNCAY